jgi:hypothetical protein
MSKGAKKALRKYWKSKNEITYTLRSPSRLGTGNEEV